MENEMAVATRQNISSIVTSSQDRIAAVDKVGEWLAKSGMFGCDRQAQGTVIALTCMETGMGLVEFSRTYDLVEGKVRKKALAALAEFEREGGTFEWVKTGDERTQNPDDQGATLKAEFKGRKVTYSYSLADAKQEGLVKDKSRWVKRPGNMLRARCITNALGMVAPAIFAGEFEDEAEPAAAPALSLEPRNITPAPAAPAAAPVPVKVVEVEVVKPDPTSKPATVAATPAVSQPQSTPAVNFSVAAVPAESKTSPPEDAKAEAAMGLAPSQGLAPDLAIGLVKAIEGAGLKIADVLRWMQTLQPGQSAPWLQPGQGIEDLTPGAAGMFTKKIDLLKARVAQFVKGGS